MPAEDGGDLTDAAAAELTDAAAAELVERSVHEPEAFAGVFDAYYDRIHRYVTQRLGPDLADDITAETFLAAFRGRTGFDTARGRVRPWLYGIATNLVRRHHRQEVRAYRALSRAWTLPVADSHEERVAAAVTAQDCAGRLGRALAGLNKGDRDVLLLVALAELSHGEVAESLGIAYGTVGSRLSRARRSVRAALGELGEAGPAATDVRGGGDAAGGAGAASRTPRRGDGSARGKGDDRG